MFERPASDPAPRPGERVSGVDRAVLASAVAAAGGATATPVAPDESRRTTRRLAESGGAVAPSPAPAARPGTEPAATRDGTQPTYRLLLVSEHRAASQALTEHLTRHGFAIVGHESTPGRAAEAARRHRPDVVLIDASVAVGWQPVVAALEGLVARGHVAVLAAYWSMDARRAATSTGIGAALLKGVNTGELVERLRTIAAAA